MLESLSNSLKETLWKVKKALFIDESLINELTKDLQRTLIRADVNVKLVFEFTNKIKERALKEKATKDTLIRIIYEELTNILGKEQVSIKITKKPFKIMLVGLLGSGKCVHPDTLVQLSSGEDIRIKEIYERYNFKDKEILKDGEIINIEDENIIVPSFNPSTFKIENKKATHLWKLIGKELFKINLDNGNDFSVRVTSEHPFFALRKGNFLQIRADNLNEDDYVAIPRTYSTITEPISLFSNLKKLDLLVTLEPSEAKRIIISKYQTIQNACNNFKYKRNCCKFTLSLKNGEIPIELIDFLNGNKIRFRNSNRFISFPEYLTLELAEFIGYVIGDGHLGKNYIQISTQDTEIIERIKYLSLNLFSLKSLIKRDTRTKRLCTIIIGSKTLVEILNKIFNIPVGKKGKCLRVPTEIMKSNDYCIISFLRAYFDCDAHAERGSRQIEVTSESNLLLRDISSCLLRLEIVSTISKKFIKELLYWRLSIRARYAEIYAKKIGFNIKYKSENISKYELIGIGQGCRKQDAIPLANILKELRTKSGFSIGEIQEVLNNSYGIKERMGFISREVLYQLKELYLKKEKGIHYNFLRNLQNKNDLNYSQPVINSLISFYKKENLIDENLDLTQKGTLLLTHASGNTEELINYLHLLAESDICWIRVKEISKCDNQDGFVYDLTVEDNHSFIADGIIVHNTTSIGKLARYYKNRSYKVCSLGLDAYRPAAREQLKQVSEKVNIPCFIDEKESSPLKVYKKFKNELEKFDIILIDTAGRHSLDKELIEELNQLKKEINPEESILVISADIGQAALTQAQSFHEACNISHIIVTKMDGTARAGGALTSSSSTGSKIVFIGTGEKFEDFEEFNPKGFISRILGLGDLDALLKKAEEVIDKESAEELSKRVLKGDFTLIDLYEQMSEMKKMGPISKLMELIPGMSNLKIPKEALQVQEGKLERWKFIMQSMTKEELEDPEIIDSDRITRIAKGCGCKESEIRDLIKQYRQSRKMVKMLKDENPEKLMKKFKGKLPGM